jgi:N-acetylglucosaminyldiphosphoundecaprenol N-acetyl-beta-D-mannosaminyltransferase
MLLTDFQHLLAGNPSQATLTLGPPREFDVPAPPAAEDRNVSILGVRIANASRPEAIALLEDLIRHRDGRTHSIFIVNAHTLNMAAADAAYRAVLNTADYVFGDGTGVRWAARLQGIRLRGNLVGTDLVPELFRATAGCGYRYFLLGADEPTIGRAARFTREEFAGWTLAGYHHGYMADRPATAQVIRSINAARPDVLLVGMGNPLQERWIRDHQGELRVPVCVGVGGLFDLWAGNVSRAPRWLRSVGHEWLWRLCQQPRDKARRYLLGNPLFLARILRDRWSKQRVSALGSQQM